MVELVTACPDELPVILGAQGLSRLLATGDGPHLDRDGAAGQQEYRCWNEV